MRRKHDFYPTPEHATRELFARVPKLMLVGRAYECCAGDGAMSKVMREIGLAVTENDADQARGRQFCMDARDPSSWRAFGRWPLVVTNPPFTVAADILRQALDHSDRVAFLLRLTFLEPCEGRERLLTERPPHRLIVLPRISFTGDGDTDSVTCAWFVWGKDVGLGVEVAGAPNDVPLFERSR